MASSRVERSPEGYLFTVYTLRVEAAVFGRPGTAVEIWQAGGLDAATGRRMIVPGVPHFRAGERAVVFLYRSRGGRLHVRGGEQGVFRASDAEQLRQRVLEMRQMAVRP